MKNAIPSGTPRAVLAVSAVVLAGAIFATGASAEDRLRSLTAFPQSD